MNKLEDVLDVVVWSFRTLLSCSGQILNGTWAWRCNRWLQHSLNKIHGVGDVPGEAGVRSGVRATVHLCGFHSRGCCDWGQRVVPNWGSAGISREAFGNMPTYEVGLSGFR
jgi:hypothetical protein